MLYRLNLLAIPIIQAAYTVTRKTVWDISDSQNILILVKEGSCLITMDGDKYVLNEGDCIFIPGNQHYRREPIDNKFCTLCYMHFILQNEIKECAYEEAKAELSAIHEKDLENVIANRDDFNLPDFTVYIPTKISLGADAEKAFDMFYETQNTLRKDALSRSITASLNLCRLLARLSNICIRDILNGSDRIVVPSSRKLRRAIIYIQSHISEPITLETLSNICHVSKQQLIRYFKSELGTTPIAYINKMKVSRTKEYLQRHPEIPINEVCAELGFEDPLYFSRLFTKIYGESPSKYRQRVRNYKPPTEDKP